MIKRELCTRDNNGNEGNAAGSHLTTKSIKLPALLIRACLLALLLFRTCAPNICRLLQEPGWKRNELRGVRVGSTVLCTVHVL